MEITILFTLSKSKCVHHQGLTNTLNAFTTNFYCALPPQLLIYSHLQAAEVCIPSLLCLCVPAVKMQHTNNMRTRSKTPQVAFISNLIHVMTQLNYM